jgi:hypothetical protein
VLDEKSTATLHLIEHGAEKRILVNVPVEVTEINGDGQPVTERTLIEDVSDFGCRFSTRWAVKQGDTVSVKVLGRYRNNFHYGAPRLYEIMWVAPKDHGYTVGARLLQGEKLASAKFPPENGVRKHEPA